MKWQKKISIAIALLILGLMSYLVLQYQSNKEKIDQLNEKIISASAVDFLDDYFFKHGRYPLNLTDLLNSLDSNNIKIVKTIFNDPFSEDKNELLLYCPIKTSSQVFSFYLISRGYDEDLNLDCEEISLKFRNRDYNNPFYNASDIWSPNYNPFAPISYDFHSFVISKKNKDLLVMFYDKETIRQRICRIKKNEGSLSLHNTMSHILKYGLTTKRTTPEIPHIVRQEVCFPTDSIELKIERDSISFSYAGYTFFCSFYHNIEMKEKRICAIAGILTEVDKVKKIIMINYCSALTKEDLSQKY